ncbi:hypothetical protein KKF03_04835 [Patescibacteria group bacterium]|nr:hypothetical protein [Patescibacteria group bacterium]MBU1165703.1 hypothetical protein [Candidatus Micrarchaeota archaeon]MBU1911307.1 hypothetical protein [Patescibacteria group bacterium]
MVQTQIRIKVAERIEQLSQEPATFKKRLLASNSTTDSRTPTYVDIAPARVYDEPGKRILIVLRTPPCPHNCTMCGFRNEAITKVTSEDLVAQLVSGLDSTLSMVETTTPVRVSLCTSSSTFNPRIPFAFWENAMQIVGRDLRVLEVDVEARADEVIVQSNISRLVHLQTILGQDKRLIVGMGLETIDNFIRNNLIGKMLPLETFESAVNSLGNAGMNAYAYVLLKPPGLTEQECVDECVKTIKYFFNLAKQANVPHFRTTLKPLFITKGTILERLYLEGLASPPTLWSLLEVLKRVHHLGTIFSPRTDENLSDDRAAKNCPECNLRVHKAIHEFNRTGDVHSLDVESCACRESMTGVKI